MVGIIQEATAGGALLVKATPSKRLEELSRNPPSGSDSEDHTFMFFNINKSLVMIDLTENSKTALLQILFNKTKVTTFDVNLPTRSYNHLELVIGFITGEILCYEIFSRTQKIFLKPATVSSQFHCRLDAQPDWPLFCFCLFFFFVLFCCVCDLVHARGCCVGGEVDSRI